MTTAVHQIKLWKSIFGTEHHEAMSYVITDLLIYIYVRFHII